MACLLIILSLAGLAGLPPDDGAARTGAEPAALFQPSSPTTRALEENSIIAVSFDPPQGFAGPSGILPRSYEQESNFLPMEDRWRLGYPYWDRYGKGFPPLDDYPYKPGAWWDPFNLNVLKGDYAIWGQNTFFILTASSSSLLEARQVPTATTPFESTSRPGQREFFGQPNQFQYQQYFRLSFDLFHGDAAFKPADWRLKLTPVFNINYTTLEELAVTNPDVRRGVTRARTFFALEEWFAEYKLADLSVDYDFMSVRAGSQFFNSDFRGLIFADVNRGVRLFGTLNANRDQFNLIFFDELEKDTNSLLNTFSDRQQNVFIANFYRQDFIFPGYTAQLSFHYNNDGPSFHFDKNDNLVRPDPVGAFQPHRVEAYYLGWAGDGHIERLNITHAFYWVLGRDGTNPIAGQEQRISAQLAAVELSYDRDWIRFRTSLLWASGDEDPFNAHATGFDAIFDNPAFAGAEFSYWTRQELRLFGVGLKQRFSLYPDLRSSKTQGQSNFVNPGLWLYNLGFDMELTPKLRLIHNTNFLWFDETAVLEQYTFDGKLDRSIGADLSLGLEYRPLQSNNVIVVAGYAILIPGSGFKDLFGRMQGGVDPQSAGFVELTLLY
jgi:hypothetical protein